VSLNFVDEIHGLNHDWHPNAVDQPEQVLDTLWKHARAALCSATGGAENEVEEEGCVLPSSLLTAVRCVPPFTPFSIRCSRVIRTLQLYVGAAEATHLLPPVLDHLVQTQRAVCVFVPVPQRFFGLV
jgi:hypothetical protein